MAAFVELRQPVAMALSCPRPSPADDQWAVISSSFSLFRSISKHRSPQRSPSATIVARCSWNLQYDSTISLPFSRPDSLKSGNWATLRKWGNWATLRKWGNWVEGIDWGNWGIEPLLLNFSVYSNILRSTILGYFCFTTMIITNGWLRKGIIRRQLFGE